MLHPLENSQLLVIEDHPAQLMTLTDILSADGLSPIGCLSGKEALAACEQHDVHVAILDLRLSDMDGLTVLQLLKERTPDIKVIINTAYASLESAIEAVNRNAFAYVQKMGNPDELLAQVHRAFHAHLAGYSERLKHEVQAQTAELIRTNAILRQEIAEHARAEEEIRRLNAELETRVQQRTAQLEEANEELKSFAYIVSHDLKAPLRSITQLITWLVEDCAVGLNDQGKEYMNLLRHRVQRMNNLINGVLEYSRIERVSRAAESIDLAQLLAEVLDTLAPPPSITITLPESLPIIHGDRIRVAQVFQNLIGNAIKFLDKPHGNITVDCADDGDRWTFTVTDNGPGIDPKQHEKIFQIFQTLHSRDEVESTGIGLTIVKKIIESSGGSIWVTSAVGQGTSFVFTLPKPNTCEQAASA